MEPSIDCGSCGFHSLWMAKSGKKIFRECVLLNFVFYLSLIQTSRWLSGKEAACRCRRRRKGGFNPSVRKIPLSGKWQPTPVFLPGQFHGQSSLVGYSPWGHKESDMTVTQQQQLPTMITDSYVRSVNIFHSLLCSFLFPR